MEWDVLFQSCRCLFPISMAQMPIQLLWPITKGKLSHARILDHLWNWRSSLEWKQCAWGKVLPVAFIVVCCKYHDNRYEQ